MESKARRRAAFQWGSLGDLQKGRPHLGPTVPVVAYRLMQYTIRDTLDEQLGLDVANDIIVKAGRLAGYQFCKNLLNVGLPTNEFIADLQRVLKEMAIGILRVESADFESNRFTVTVAEDLDCSGLPCTDEVVCGYDEGFIAGIMEAYSGKPFQAKEIDCWASGARVCRFDVRMIEDGE